MYIHIPIYTIHIHTYTYTYIYIYIYIYIFLHIIYIYIGSSTILDLNQNDLVSMWSYREGNGGALNIQHGHLTIRRIA